MSSSERAALKAIWRLTAGSAGEPAAKTGDVASALELSPATVTSTVKRLADRGLVVHAPYRGVELTREGRRVAMAVIRRHRIVERFLADLLGYSWSEADRLAPSFEHQLPQEVEDRLFVALDRPATCPHGFPIPDPESDGLPEMPSLYSLMPGDQAIVALPGSTDPAVAAFLEELGLRPGVKVEIRDKQPFDGPLVLRIDGADRTLGERVARHIFVQGPSNGAAPLEALDGKDRNRPGEGHRDRAAARNERAGAQGDKGERS